MRQILLKSSIIIISFSIIYLLVYKEVFINFNNSGFPFENKNEMTNKIE
jgi:uncharacterized protein YpmB